MTKHLKAPFKAVRRPPPSSVPAKWKQPPRLLIAMNLLMFTTLPNTRFPKNLEIDASQLAQAHTQVLQRSGLAERISPL